MMTEDEWKTPETIKKKVLENFPNKTPDMLSGL